MANIVSKHSALWAKGRLLAAILSLAAAPASFADVAVETDRETISRAINAKDRPTSDLRADERRKPEAVLALMSLRKGMRVLDVFAGSGYYTELLSRIVGPTGEVVYHSNAFYARSLKVALNRRFDDQRLNNVSQEFTPLTALELSPESYDRVLLALTYHDYYFEDRRGMRLDPPAFLRRLKDSLKPNGRVVIVDHNAAAGRGIEDAARLHRIEESHVIADFQAAGYRLVGSSDKLRNPDDDHTKSVFDPAIRRKTDRFVLAFEKRRD